MYSIRLTLHNSTRISSGAKGTAVTVNGQVIFPTINQHFQLHSNKIKNVRRIISKRLIKKREDTLILKIKNVTAWVVVPVKIGIICSTEGGYKILAL